MPQKQRLVFFGSPEFALAPLKTLYLGGYEIVGIYSQEPKKKFRGQKKYNTPVLMLSAMKETKNRIVGFEEGADDYLGKPFEPQELLLRIKAVLRRTEENKLTSTYDNNLIKFGNILYNPDISIVWKNNNKITLTSKENELLKILLEGKGNTIDRYVLINNLKLGSRGIDITISRLRKKIENNPKSPLNILTIRGKGYSLPQNTLKNQ